MPKYTDEQLKDMAQQVVEAESNGDMRALRLYIAVAMRLGAEPSAVRTHIQALASCEN